MVNHVLVPVGPVVGRVVRVGPVGRVGRVGPVVGRRAGACPIRSVQKEVYITSFCTLLIGHGCGHLTWRG